MFFEMQPFIGITKCGWKKQHLKCLTLGWIAPSSPKSLVCGWKAMASSIAIKTMFGLESPSTWMPMHTATWHIHMLIPRSCVHPKPHRIVCQNTMAPAMSSLKRPASSLKQKAGSHSQAAKKRPAAKERKPDEEVEVPQEKEEQEESEEEKQTEDPEVDTPKLTKKALKDHNKFLEAASNMNEKKFMEALSKLEPKAAQKLWKKFQNSRKAANCEDEYQDVMKHSAGSLERKRKLLFQWVQNDKSCGDRYREYMEKVSLVKSDGVKQKWLTSQQALGTWGKEELWSRVQAGTILARRCPQDKRYWEFRCVQEVSKTEVKRAKETKATWEGKLDKNTALEYQHMDWGKLAEDDWEVSGLDGDEEEEEQGTNQELAKALGVKPTKDKDKPEKDKANKEKEWEEASKVSKADTKESIKDKMMKFKAELEKDKSQLDSKEHEAKKSGLKDIQLYKEKKEVTQKLEAPTKL